MDACKSCNGGKSLDDSVTACLIEQEIARSHGRDLREEIVHLKSSNWKVADALRSQTDFKISPAVEETIRKTAAGLVLLVNYELVNFSQGEVRLAAGAERFVILEDFDDVKECTVLPESGTDYLCLIHNGSDARLYCMWYGDEQFSFQVVTSRRGVDVLLNFSDSVYASVHWQ